MLIIAALQHHRNLFWINIHVLNVTLFVHKGICEQIKHFVLFPAAHPGALRPAKCGGGELLGVPGGDGASSGPQLHPHCLGQTQPPRPCQGGVCRVGKLFQPDPSFKSPQINGFIYKCPDTHFVRAISGALEKNSPAVSDLLSLVSVWLSVRDSLNFLNRY